MAWIGAYADWSDRIDAGLARGDYTPATRCDEAYATDVGEAPVRLTEAATLALDGCTRLRRAISGSDPQSVADEWYVVRARILDDLTDRRARVATPVPSAELVAQATPLAGIRPEVLCWSSTDWEKLSEEWRLIKLDEFWLLGYAHYDGGRIHLRPRSATCSTASSAATTHPHLNQESYDLAVALVTLAHEAEHLRSPGATEAQVECVAIQRVRDLVRDAGRSKSYEDLMTGLAWDVGYPNEPARATDDRVSRRQCARRPARDVRLAVESERRPEAAFSTNS